jgi:chitinase
MNSILKAAPLLAALLGNLHATQPSRAEAGSNPASAPAPASERVAADKSGKVLMGYYPNWSRYSAFTAEKIPFDYLTHILYAFYITDEGGNISNADPLDEENFKNLIRLAHARNVKVLLSIGGAAQSATFKPMAASASARANFIKNCLKISDRMQLDGIDIDWEYPLEGDGPNQEKLHREMRAAFDAHTSRKLLFTAAVPVVDYWAHWSTDDAFKQLDFLNCMTYDYMGTWEKAILPNSGMDMSKNTMTYFEGRGIPKAKLVMGAAFYGKSFDAGTGMGSAFDGTGSGLNGVWYWKDLLDQFKQSPYKILWDEKTQSEYALGNDEIIVFNGLPSQRARGEFIRNSDYGGVMLWDLNCDVLDPKQSLLVALYRGLRGTNKSAMVTPPLQ